jgi:thioredoxin reductase
LIGAALLRPLAFRRSESFVTYDLVIIGGGPAGASAAIFAGRAGLRTVVVDDGAGMAQRALVNNHLGLPEGMEGPEFIALGRRQVEAVGVEWLEDQATSLASKDDVVTLGTAGGRTLEARDALLAQGTNTTLAADAGITVEAGREPWIKSVVTVDATGRTSAPHVWAAGTVAGTSVHTIIVAGDGARVAVNVISDRRGERHVDHDVLETPPEQSSVG